MKLNFGLHFFFHVLKDGKENSSTGEEEKHSFTKESAAVIISVAFNVISLKYITRVQLSFACKTLKRGLKSTLPKEEYIVPVATALIKQGFIKVRPSEKVTGTHSTAGALSTKTI